MLDSLLLSSFADELTKTGVSIGVSHPLKKLDPQGRIHGRVGIGTSGPTVGIGVRIGKGTKLKNGDTLYPTLGMGPFGPTIGMQVERAKNRESQKLGASLPGDVHLAERFRMMREGIPTHKIIKFAKEQKEKLRMLKRGDDPGDVPAPRVKGLKGIRNAAPRLRMGTKGQVPVNPFSGNTVYPSSGTSIKVAMEAADPLYAALGIGTLAGAGYLGHQTYKKMKRPYEEPEENLHARTAKIMAARALSKAHPLLPYAANAPAARRGHRLRGALSLADDSSGAVSLA